LSFFIDFFKAPLAARTCHSAPVAAGSGVSDAWETAGNGGGVAKKRRCN